jgi:hypothetical protein
VCSSLETGLPTRLWDGYIAYRKAVRAASPQGLTLRECDPFLWGRSAFKQLKQDIDAGFPGKS